MFTSRLFNDRAQMERRRRWRVDYVSGFLCLFDGGMRHTILFELVFGEGNGELSSVYVVDVALEQHQWQPEICSVSEAHVS